MGQGKAGGGGGHAVGSVGTGVEGEESGRGEERGDMEESEGVHSHSFSHSHSVFPNLLLCLHLNFY